MAPDGSLGVFLLLEANQPRVCSPKVAVAGMEGEFRESHELDEKMAEKIPKARIGKRLSRTSDRTSQRVCIAVWRRDVLQPCLRCNA
jgi:hypothetical protein